MPEQSQGVQAWDRYAYTNNNPVRYNDPSGHCVLLEEDSDGLCVITEPKAPTHLSPSTIKITVVRGGSVFPNRIEFGLANAFLTGNLNWLNAIPEDTSPLAMQYSVVTVAAKLGYKTGYGDTDPGVVLAGLLINNVGDPEDDDDDAYGGVQSEFSRKKGTKLGPNFAQNRQFMGAVREVERQLGRPLKQWEVQKLHYEMQHLEDHGFWKIVEHGLDMFK